MQINGPSSLSNAQAVKPTNGRTNGVEAAQESRSIDTTDELTLSSEAQAVAGSRVNASSTDFRADKVAQLRAQIADGSYETPEKLDVALDRLIDQLG